MWAIQAQRVNFRAAATLAVLLCIASLPGTASADRFVGVAGGATIPYQGSVGWNVLGEIGGNMWGSKHFLGGAEFEFKRQDVSAAASGAPDVAVDQYNVRLLARFVFAPKKLTPYLGGGGGLGAASTKATSTRPSELGMTSSIIGLAGMNFPIAGGRISFFGEARFGYTWVLTGDFSNVKQKGFDGFSGVGGMRFRF